MVVKFPRIALVAGVVTLVSGPWAAAQVAQPAAATHKHYESAPAGQPAGPQRRAGAAAAEPRRAHLPGEHDQAGGAALHQPGAEPGLRVQPRRGAARRSARRRGSIPTLAIAYWGQALVLGPNINAMMEPNEEPHADELIQKAQSLKGRATPRERALIDALAKRYSGSADHRTANDAAYAEAMRAVHKQFPADLDIAMLYVESMMDLRPWGYWMPDGRPHEGTTEIVALTEDVLRRNPKHPGALHMQIHLVEATTTPERAEKAADALMPLMPAAGHMVHMASHIYQRVGRYADAMKSNQLAIAADEDYITQCRAQGLYPMAYYPHNIHFLWFAATARRAVGRGHRLGRRRSPRRSPTTVLAEMPLTAGFRVVPYWANVRFGRWDEILKEPAPPDTNVFLTARLALRARHGLRGHRHACADAEKELAALTPLLAHPSLDAPQLLAQHRPRDHEHRAGGAGRRDRRRQGRLRHGDGAPRARRAARGRAGLHRAVRVGLPAAALRSARCCSRPAGRPRPRPSTGRTSSATARTAGR